MKESGRLTKETKWEELRDELDPPSKPKHRKPAADWEQSAAKSTPPALKAPSPVPAVNVAPVDGLASGATANADAPAPETSTESSEAAKEKEEEGESAEKEGESAEKEGASAAAPASTATASDGSTSTPAAAAVSSTGASDTSKDKAETQPTGVTSDPQKEKWFEAFVKELLAVCALVVERLAFVRILV